MAALARSYENSPLVLDLASTVALMEMEMEMENPRSNYLLNIARFLLEPGSPELGRGTINRAGKVHGIVAEKPSTAWTKWHV